MESFTNSAIYVRQIIGGLFFILILLFFNHKTRLDSPCPVASSYRNGLLTKRFLMRFILTGGAQTLLLPIINYFMIIYEIAWFAIRLKRWWMIFLFVLIVRFVIEILIYTIIKILLIVLIHSDIIWKPIYDFLIIFLISWFTNEQLTILFRKYKWFIYPLAF